MEEIQIYLEDLIGNAMIEIYKKDKRRILDIRDIVNYQSLITDELNKKGMDPIFFGEDDELYQSTSKYFCSCKGNNFIVLPWISIRDLVKHYRKDMQLDVYHCFCNSIITNGLLNRTEKELNRFNEINNEVINTYINQLSVNNSYLNIKREEKKKVLERIKNIRNQKL